MVKILPLFILLTVQSAGAYVMGRSDSGKIIKWNTTSKKIKLFVDSAPVNTSSFDLDKTSFEISNMNLTTTEYVSLKTKEVVEESINEWNQVSPYNFEIAYTDSTPFQFSDVNYLSYSSNFNYFTSSTIAVTTAQLNPFTGYITSVGVLINQSFIRPSVDLTFEKDNSSGGKAYLGDVLTHELGHALGLSHSEAAGASMVYSIFKGQHEINDDDIAGIYETYNISTNGAIKGKVVTGNEIPVFGANVNVISVISNKHIQSQLTDESGIFYFDNLDLDDSYYIQVVPVKSTAHLNDYYKNISHNLCDRNLFKPTFFQECGPRSKGRPQTFKLDTSNDYIDAGVVSISCDENLNPDYYATKFETVNDEFNLLENSSTSHVILNGYFSSEEVQLGEGGKGDKFQIDFSGIDPQDFSLGSLVNRVSLSSTAIGSSLSFVVYTKRDDEAGYSRYSSTTDPTTGKTLTDLNVDLQLSGSSANNKFEIIVYPEALSSTQVVEIFSSPDVVQYEDGQYIISNIVGSNTADGFESLGDVSNYPYSDNLSCLDGDNVRGTGSYESLSSSANASQLEGDDAQVSCGSVDLSGGSGGSGGMSFFIGFLMIFGFLQLSNNKHISLSKF